MGFKEANQINGNNHTIGKKQTFGVFNATNCQNLHFDIADNQMPAAHFIAVSITLL